MQQGVEHLKCSILKGNDTRSKLHPAEKYNVRKIFRCRNWPTGSSGNCVYYQRAYAACTHIPGPYGAKVCTASVRIISALVCASSYSLPRWKHKHARIRSGGAFYRGALKQTAAHRSRGGIPAPSCQRRRSTAQRSGSGRRGRDAQYYAPKTLHISRVCPFSPAA